MSLSKESIKKLRAVKRAILAEPELYDQTIFASSVNPCGSACCLAGWAVWLESPMKFNAMATGKDRTFWYEEASRSLGLPSTIGSRMFGTGESWPEPYASKRAWSRTNKQRAAVAAGRIEHFIKTGGFE